MRRSAGCTGSSKEERDIVISSRPLEATAFPIDNIRIACTRTIGATDAGASAVDHSLVRFGVARSLRFDRSLSARRSSSVSASSAEPRFFSSRFSLDVHGIGTIHGLCASTHATATCAGVARFRETTPPKPVLKTKAGQG